MASPNLSITEVTPGQDGKVNRINQARDNLELALTNPVTITNGTATVTLTTTEAGEALGNIFYRFNGTPGGTQTVNVPANTKMYAIENALTDDNDIIVQVTGGGGASVTVPAGLRVLLYVDAAGDVIALGAAVLASGGAGLIGEALPFGKVDGAAAADATFLDTIGPLLGSTTIGYEMTRAGSVIGIGVQLEATETTPGTIDVDVLVAGSIVFSTQITTTGSGRYTSTSTQSPGIDAIAAGDAVSVQVNYGTYTGTFEAVVCHVEVALEL